MHNTKHFCAALVAIALFGAGCAPAPAPTPKTPPSVEIPTTPAGHPPAVVMTIADQMYPGVEGSYCYAGTCADKIGPPDLIASAGLSYKDTNDGETAYFQFGSDDVFEFAVNMTNASGTDLGIKIPVSFRDGRYTVKVPNVSGKNIFLAFVRFGEAGHSDVSYVFPVNVR